MTKYEQLLASKQNVFSMDTLSSIWGQNKRSDTIQSARDLARAGKIHRLRRGLYALDQNALDIYEVANRAFAPSYITGQTILTKHGLTFQFSHQIHCAAPKPKHIAFGDTTIIYHMLKPEVFNNDLGIEHVDGVAIATLERAIADLIYYTDGKYNFEYMDGVNWGKLQQIAKIYHRKTLLKKIKELKEIYHGK